MSHLSQRPHNASSSWRLDVLLRHAALAHVRRSAMLVRAHCDGELASYRRRRIIDEIGYRTRLGSQRGMAGIKLDGLAGTYPRRHSALVVGVNYAVGGRHLVPRWFDLPSGRRDGITERR